jgi:hypothetical protein
MSFTAIISGIFSTVKSIRVIADLIDRGYELWIDAKIEGLDKAHFTKLDKRKAISKSIRGAKDDETRKTLSIILADIS